MPAEWHELYARAAADNGVSVAAYFREAAFIRWAFESAIRETLEAPEAVGEALEDIERLSRRLHALYGMRRGDE